MASYAVPAAAAAVASALYIDGKAELSYDFHSLRQWVQLIRSSKQAEKNDTNNYFFKFEAQVHAYPEQIFLFYEDRSWTYKQAHDTILRHARWLKEQCGIKSRAIIAMSFTNKPEFLWIWFGLWSLGAIPAFINYNLAGKPLIHSLRTSTAETILVDEEIQQNFVEEVLKELDSKVSVNFFSTATEASISSLQPFREDDAVRRGVKSTDGCLLIYTSGTTGFPKAAIIPWSRVTRASAFTSGFLKLTRSDVYHTAMPLYHSAGSLLCFCTAITAATPVSLAHRFSPRTFWRDVRAHNATIIQYVGETLRYLVSVPPSPEDKNHKVRLAFGNGLRPDVWHLFKERFAIDTIIEFYASTEGSNGMWNISRNDYAAGAVGHSGALLRYLFKGTSEIVKFDVHAEQPVRDPATGLCVRADQGEAGELLARLDENNIKEGFSGYYRDTSSTDKKILRDVMRKGDAYFRTGDLIRREGGSTYFVDRIGDTFRWKSENVATSEVASVMGSHPAVAEANVYGVLVPGHDGRAGCATLVLKDGARLEEATLAGLAELARANLAHYAVPVFLRVAEKLETTGTNKTVKHALREEGVEPGKVEKGGSGDRLFWLRGAAYVPFRERDWERLQGEGVRL